MLQNVETKYLDTFWLSNTIETSPDYGASPYYGSGYLCELEGN